jgi:hypothetical protein
MDLLFSATAVSTDLVFGASDVVTHPDAVIACNAALSGLSGYVSIARAIQVALLATLPSLNGVVGVAYASGTERPTVGQVFGVAQVARRTESGWQQPEQHATATVTGTQGRFTKAAGVEVVVSMGFTESNRVKIGADNAFAESTQLEARRLQSSAQNASPHARISRSSRFANATRAPLARLDGRFQDGLRDRRLQVRGGWQIGARFLLGHQDHAGPAAPSAIQRGGRFQEAKRPPAGMSVGVGVVVPVHGQYTPSPHLLFWDTLFGSHLVFGRKRHAVDPVAPGTIVIPVREVYMIINEATLTRVEGDISIPVSSMTLSLDVDSWAWGFAATISGRALGDLEPSTFGAPVEVEAMVNGVPYRALVESISSSREFGKHDLRVQGRGRTALLDTPYAPMQTFGNTGARTAQQLMGDVLTVNGVAMSWDVNWGLTDWLVPTGAFSHQGSYISALNVIAAAAGAVIQPHASLDQLYAMPRYAVAPWDWGTVTPDYDLPSALMTRESIDWAEKARYNRVFVSGVGQGVLGQVTRTGTAGDMLAPMITDALITHADAARQRGLSVLANTGRIAQVGLRLPVLPATGIITPGKMVRYVDGAEVRRGVVRSVAVDVSMPEIWQSITVETHVN